MRKLETLTKDEYAEIRKALFDKITQIDYVFEALNDKDKFIYLLSNFQKYSANYITKCWLKRQSKLYK